MQHHIHEIPALGCARALGASSSGMCVWGVGILVLFHGRAEICWPFDTWKTHTEFWNTLQPASLVQVWYSEVISAGKSWVFIYIWWKSLRLLHPLEYLPVDSWSLGHILFLTCDFGNNFLLKPGWNETCKRWLCVMFLLLLWVNSAPLCHHYHFCPFLAHVQCHHCVL